MPPKRLSTSETHKKRCRKSVTLATKVEVLRRIEDGEKIVHICKAMGLAKSTIQSIRDKKEDINTYLQSAAPLNISRLTRQRNWIMEKMENLLIIWIEDNNKSRIPMSQISIQEKALSIFENLKNEDTTESAEGVTFQASRGWFEKFKNRYNLYKLKVNDEAADNNPEQEFNVDEIGVFWKRMPTCDTHISKTKKSPPGYYKVSKERLALLIRLLADTAFDEGTEPAISKQPTSKNLLEAFSNFEQGINILLKNDPDVARSAKVSRGIYSALSCYKSLNKKIDKKARQITLDNFVKPGPSLPSKNDHDSDLHVSISSSSSG